MRDYIYSDTQHPLTIQPSGNVGVVYNEEAIKQSLTNILATVVGERVRSPIGSSLLRYLFRPMAKNSENDIRDVIIRDIMKHEPRLSGLEVYVRANFDKNLYDVVIIAQIAQIRRPIEVRTRLRSMTTT
jgi:phage baseplate assembly protein W